MQLLLCKISGFSTFNVVDLLLIFISSIHNFDRNFLFAGNVQGIHNLHRESCALQERSLVKISTDIVTINDI